MTRHHATRSSIVRRLRLSPDRFAAAAALQDPNLLLQLRVAQSHREQPTKPPRASRPLRRRRGVLRSIGRALTGETGGALLLVAAVVLALLWSNSPWQASYAAFWHSPVALTVGPWTLGADLRTWIDEGLMTLFFLVVGLEAKRERDLGELREGRRLTVPVLAALAGMMASAAVYVVGKPLGIVIASCAALRGRAVLSLSWPELGGTALSAGIGFTVSLLIASRAFDGALLDQAKVGILATALVTPALAVAALASLRRRDGAAPVRRGYRLAATSPCAAQ